MNITFVYCLLPQATSSDGLLSPSKQLMLLKLVQSIQNSGREEGETPSSRDREHSRTERRPSGRSSRPRPRSGYELPSGKVFSSLKIVPNRLLNVVKCKIDKSQLSPLYVM